MFMIFVTIALVQAAILPRKRRDRRRRHSDDPPVPDGPFDECIRQVHPYSGLGSQLYEGFIHSLTIFQETLEVEHLYQAIHNLEELTMYKDHDFDESIITQIGSIGERMAKVEHPIYKSN